MSILVGFKYKAPLVSIAAFLAAIGCALQGLRLIINSYLPQFQKYTDYLAMATFVLGILMLIVLILHLFKNGDQEGRKTAKIVLTGFIIIAIIVTYLLLTH